MFKKPPRIKALSNLKNSERKKLLQSVKEQINQPDFTYSSNVIKQTNFIGVNAMGTVYTNEENIPIFFKEKHKDILYPTVYTTWEHPDMIPIILTHDFVIEEKIFNGANLMIAGTIPPFEPRCTIGTVCGIASRQKPDVVEAIGIVNLDLPKYKSVLGEQGIAVTVIHHFNDELFPEFKVKLTIPDSVKTSKGEVISQENDDSQTSNSQSDDSTSNHTKSQNIDDIAEVLEKLTVSDVDYLMTRSLYYTVKEDSSLDLPISASNFISNHIMHNLPPVDHNEVNVKKSSWKKTAKLLKHFEKEGFLKLKGKGDDLTIVGVNKEKEELKNFVPYKTGSEVGVAKSKNNNLNDSSSRMMFSVISYKPINLAKDFVKEVNLPSKILYTPIDIKEGVNEYIRIKNLVDNKNKKMILLDDMLFNMVYKKTKNIDLPRIVSRAAILEPILANNFTEYYQIFRDEETSLFKNPIRGIPPKIQIITEMKIGRKIVTKVSNFEVFDITPDELAADLRKLCSGSTTIGETMTSPKTAEVQVQGPHGQIVIDHLNKLGVPTKWINFENKLKKGKKRR